MSLSGKPLLELMSPTALTFRNRTPAPVPRSHCNAHISRQVRHAPELCAASDVICTLTMVKGRCSFLATPDIYTDRLSLESANLVAVCKILGFDGGSDVSDELSASIIRVTRIGEGGTLAVIRNRRTLRRNTSCISCHPDDGSDKFLRNVGSYKSHTA
jgi:hypothetical protein